MLDSNAWNVIESAAYHAGARPRDDRSRKELADMVAKMIVAALKKYDQVQDTLQDHSK